LAKLKNMHEGIMYFNSISASHLRYKSFEGFPPALPSIKIKHVAGEGVEIDIRIERLKRIESWLRDLKSKIENYDIANCKVYADCD